MRTIELSTIKLNKKLEHNFSNKLFLALFLMVVISGVFFIFIGQRVELSFRPEKTQVTNQELAPKK